MADEKRRDLDKKVKAHLRRICGRSGEWWPPSDIPTNSILTMGDVRKILRGGRAPPSVIPPQSYNDVWRSLSVRDFESMTHPGFDHFKDGWTGVWPFRSYHVGMFYAKDRDPSRSAVTGSGADIWLKVTPSLLTYLQTQR